MIYIIMIIIIIYIFVPVQVIHRAGNHPENMVVLSDKLWTVVYNANL